MHCDMFWSLALKIAVGKQNCVGLGDSHRLFARTADTVFSRNHLWVKDTHGDHRPGKQGWWADAKPQIAACFFWRDHPKLPNLLLPPAIGHETSIL